MLARRPASLPQRILQALGQRLEALAAFNHFDMLPARESQHKVIQDMHERHPGNGESDSEQQKQASSLIISGSGLNLPTKKPAPVKELPTDLVHGKKLMEAVDRAMEKHQNEPSN